VFSSHLKAESCSILLCQRTSGQYTQSSGKQPPQISLNSQTDVGWIVGTSVTATTSTVGVNVGSSVVGTIVSVASTVGSPEASTLFENNICLAIYTMRKAKIALVIKIIMEFNRFLSLASLLTPSILSPLPTFRFLFALIARTIHLITKNNNQVRKMESKRFIKNSLGVKNTVNWVIKNEHTALRMPLIPAFIISYKSNDDFFPTVTPGFVLFPLAGINFTPFLPLFGKFQ